MVNYIVTVIARPGHEAQVAEFYQAQEDALNAADGFIGRKIFKAQTGKMVEAVRKMYTPEELAKHPEPPHDDPGTQFILIEQWESVDQRMQHSKKAEAARAKDLIPHLLPQHSHEFYEDISVA